MLQITACLMARSAAEPTSPRQAHTSARDYDVDMELLDRLIVSSPAALRAGLAHNWPALPPAPFIPVAHRIELLALFAAAACRRPCAECESAGAEFIFSPERAFCKLLFTQTAYFCCPAMAAFMVNLCRIAPLR